MASPTVNNTDLCKRLMFNIEQQLKVFKARCFAAGKVVPEVIAFVAVGDELAIRRAKDLLDGNFVNKFFDKRDDNMLHGEFLYGPAHAKLICTISHRKKKIEELERAEKQVAKLKRELEALPED